MRIVRVMLGFTVLACIMAVAIAPPAALGAAATQTVTVAEGADYATLVLRDPWEMSQYSDVSQYLNESGQRNILQNIQVQNGVFSAGATSQVDAAFFPLFPGYASTMLVGRNGTQYPITAATYRCLYLAMKVDSTFVVGNPDQLVVYWFEDEWMNNAGAPGGIHTWGQTPGIPTYYESLIDGSNTVFPSWKLYEVRLASYDFKPLTGQVNWNERSLWRGLRIDPTQQVTDFQVDWVRLTDCAAKNLSLTLSAGTYQFYLTTADARQIFVKEFSHGGGTYNMDVQGVAPGTYTYLVTTGGTYYSPGATVQTGTLVVNPTPIADFARPSFVSGEDYASMAGNPWDFTSSSDAQQLLNFTSATFHDGVLDMNSPSGPLPAGVDAQIHLNTPAQFDAGEYRYLSFRMTTTWNAPYQDIPDGMIARWLWTIPGLSGIPGKECDFDSQDIPYDIGTYQVSIDLFDAFNGKAELTEPIGGDCPALDSAQAHWSSLPGPIIKTRFDPNENVTCNPPYGAPVPCSAFSQQLDWIRLTKENRVTQGLPYLVQIGLDRPPAQVSNRTFYYTTNRQQPTQNPAMVYTPPAPTPGAFNLYLPVALRNFVASDLPPVANSVAFMWDTSLVVPGTYYLCVTVGDGVNSGTYCSEAPVIIQ